MELKVYEIVDVKDRDGNEKIIPSKWYRKYTIYFLESGASAILVDNDNFKALRTSTVESYNYKYDGEVVITTRNTVYTLREV